MTAIALKTPWEFLNTSSWSWPKEIYWHNFWEVLTDPNISFFNLFKNSLTISTLYTLGSVGSSSLVAYAFARLNFKGKNRLFILTLSTLMLPSIITMIPTYTMYKYLHWVNTFYPLIVPGYFGSAFSIIMLKQFFSRIPKELSEAAILDGASHWTIYSQIILPLSKPALATAGVYSFVYSWRDFLGPLLYLNEPEKQTLELGLQTYRTFHSEQWHLLMAGSILVLIPILILFFIFQKFFMRTGVNTIIH